VAGRQVAGCVAVVVVVPIKQEQSKSLYAELGRRRGRLCCGEEQVVTPRRGAGYLSPLAMFQCMLLSVLRSTA